jgi:phage-related protein
MGRRLFFAIVLAVVFLTSSVGFSAKSGAGLFNEHCKTCHVSLKARDYTMAQWIDFFMRDNHTGGSFTFLPPDDFEAIKQYLINKSENSGSLSNCI